MCKLYAYCRVSTERQSLARQIENVTKVYPNAIIYSDKWTGSTMDRPNWQKLYKILKEGDTVVFDSVSRMSRDANEGSAIYEELYNKGVNLVFLAEPHINTSEYKRAMSESLKMTGNEIADLYIEATNKVLMILARRQVEIAFSQAEKERLDICKRVKDGMRAAKNKAAENGETKTYGTVPGRKLNIKKANAAKEVIRKHSKDFDGTLSDADVIKLAGISRNSYYKYKAELRNE